VRDFSRGGVHDSAFRQLDDFVRSPTATGVVLVSGELETLEAVAIHLERRVRAAQRHVVRWTGSGTDDAFRELTQALMVGGRAARRRTLSGGSQGKRASSSVADPVVAGAALFDAMGHGVLIVVDAAFSRWGWATAAELGRHTLEQDLSDGVLEQEQREPPATRHQEGPLVILMSEHPGLLPPPMGAVVLEVSSGLTTDEAQLWWQAISADRPSAPRVERLDALEAWWSAAKATPADARLAATVLDDASRRLLAGFALLRRAVPLDRVSRLEPDAAGDAPSFDEDALAQLVESELLRVDARRQLVPGPRYAMHVSLLGAEPSASELVHAATMLEEVWPDDPWASARASELLFEAGDVGLAESSAFRALISVTDASAREDFWGRWASCLDVTARGARLTHLLRAADLALRVGDVDRALEFARRATSVGRDGSSTRVDGEDPQASAGFDALLMLGRATAARGDLTTAAITLSRAIVSAETDGQKARAAVELSETHYSAGDLERARSHAESALVDAPDLSTRLLARNVLGKLLLARSSWEDAEKHFATDASDAACGGDPVGELRARLNRGIALFSSGRLDDARSMLLSVLDDGERRGELRGTSFALANLAAIATLRHDYVEALQLSERAIDVSRRIGEKIGLSRLITNLAELRLRLGMVGEAEQALAFGRGACGPGMPAARMAHFSLVGARVHLARGQTVEAAARISSALAGASGSSDGAMVGECHRVAARIALEDGDLARAKDAIDLARAETMTNRARGELLILEASRLRALGEPFRLVAEDALTAARQADDDELSREALVLLHLASRIDSEDGGDGYTPHLEAAIAMRSRVADVLPEALRTTFLARRNLRELGQLEARAHALSLDGGGRRAAGAEHPRGLGQGWSARSGSALERMVGEDTALATLKSAIRKVGPSDATVFIHGESGTGKELVAEALHQSSARKGGPLVKVNCAALVETLLLSELFGHEKGAFTGAVGRRRGRFELAEGGTIFLDEIGDISPRTQVALLRVLQDRMFERVGGMAPIRANVRIVCASHRDLRAMVQSGEFREDLYYRLRGLVLEVPALRDRIGDLPLVAGAILRRIADERRSPRKHLSTAAIEALARHRWPGNIRELENALRAAALFAEEDALDVDDFVNNVDGLRDLRGGPSTLRQGEAGPASMRGSVPPGSIHELGTIGASASSAVLSPSIPSPPSALRPSPLAADAMGEDSRRVDSDGGAYERVRAGISLADLKRQIERECIVQALEESDGNITKAASLLGMKRPRLSQLVKQYGLLDGSVLSSADDSSTDDSSTDDGEGA